MRGVTIWRKLLDVEQVQVLDVTLQEDAGAPALVISVRPTKGARGRCASACGGVLGMTRAAACAGGGRWIMGRRWCLCRPQRRG